MTKSKTTGLWLPFALLCLLGGCILFFPGYRFSAWVIFGIAGLVLAYQLLKLLDKRCHRFASVTRKLLTAALCAVVAAAIITGILIVRAGAGTPEPDCDYLIVLGAGVNGTVPSLTLRERLDAAYDYMQTHNQTICIVSGGQGPGEDITEAACMADWLTEKGVDPSRIWQEDKATSTQENLSYSLAMIENATGSRPETVGILSSEYHLYRAGLMAQEQETEPVLIPAETGWLSLRLNYYMREIAGVWYYLIFGS